MKYAHGGNMTIQGRKVSINKLEENTKYDITVHAIINNKMSSNNHKVTIITYADGKLFKVNHVSESVSFIVCTCTAPSSPPEKVLVKVFNSRTLIVSFSSPSIIDQNGKLTRYVIRYKRVGSRDIKSVNATKTTIYLSRLEEFVKYSIRVAAVNGNGTGPFSKPVEQTTGKINQLSTCDLVVVHTHCVYRFMQLTLPHTLNIFRKLTLICYQIFCVYFS